MSFKPSSSFVSKTDHEEILWFTESYSRMYDSSPNGSWPSSRNKKQCTEMPEWYEQTGLSGFSPQTITKHLSTGLYIFSLNQNIKTNNSPFFFGLHVERLTWNWKYFACFVFVIWSHIPQMSSNFLYGWGWSDCLVFLLCFLNSGSMRIYHHIQLT